MGTGVSHKRIATGNFRVIKLICIHKKSDVESSLSEDKSTSCMERFVATRKACFHTQTCHYIFLNNSTVKQPLLLFLRKEVIQPHLPIRLPCYDFTPVIGSTFGSSLLTVGSLTSGISNSHGVTGGVYKTRERIHHDILIRDY